MKPLWLYKLRIGSIRKPLFKPGRERRPVRTLATLLAVFIVLVVGLQLVNIKLRPVVAQVARARVSQLATAAIHDAITRRLVSDEYCYEKLVGFEKDIYGQITALKTDMMTVNRLKSDVTLDVLEAISSLGASELGIPFGNFLNSELLSGRGPKVRIRIVPVGTASAAFSNVFTAAGINQTRHQIMMTVTADLTVLLPGYSEMTTVSVQVSIAETVIVGTVPDSYLSIDK